MSANARAALSIAAPLAAIAAFAALPQHAFAAQAMVSHQAPAPDSFDGPRPARSGVPAWFGLRLPGPETDPETGIFGSRADDLPARPPSVRLARRDLELRGSTIFRDVRTIVSFSHASRASGDYLWGRVTGRPSYDRTVNWVASKLRRAGLTDAHLEPFRARLNLPLSGEVRLLGTDRAGNGSRDIVLHSAMVQGNGPVNGSVTAPLVYVGQGTEADLAQRDLAGRIAVLVSTPSPSLYAPVPARRIGAALKAGAVGVIEILVQPGNLKSFDRDRHGCGTGLCFTVGGEDGFFLQNVLGRAAGAGIALSARLSAASTTLDRDVANVVATVRGRTRRTVIVVAHADGWFGGADDNASGLAVLVALARHFAKGPPPLRTLVFVASAGHHSAGANGLAVFRANHERDYVARADLILNVEHVAQSATLASYVDDQDNGFGMRTIKGSGDLPKQVAVNNRAPFLVHLWRLGVSCFGLDTQRVVDARLPGDLKAFSDRPDIPQTQMIASGQLYHTSGDDLYAIPPEGLERAAGFYAFMIGQVANAPADLIHGAAWTPTAASSAPQGCEARE